MEYNSLNAFASRPGLAGRVLLLSALLLLPARAQVGGELPPGVELHEYTGWPNCLLLNASELPVQAVVVPAVGGRMVHFSYNGQNILLENTASQGVILGHKNEDLLFGGYQCDIGPEEAHLSSHWTLSEGPERWTAPANFSTKVFSAPDPDLGIELDKEFVLAGDTGELGVQQRLRNISAAEVKYCLTDRTICKSGGYVLLPLNPHSRFKAGWALAHNVAGRTILDGQHPDAYGVTVRGNLLVAETGGDVTHFGADSDAQWIAYARGKLLFVKYYLYSPKADYGNGGVSVEVYFDRRVTELDPSSPVTRIQAGGVLDFPEKWMLLPLEKEVNSAEDARKLVWRIPPPPF